MSSRCLAQDKPILQGTPSALSALEDEEQKGRRTPLYSAPLHCKEASWHYVITRCSTDGVLLGSPFNRCFVCSPMPEIIYVTSKM